MNIKRNIFLKFLTVVMGLQLVVTPVKAISFDDCKAGTAFLVALAGISTGWALWERYKKNQVKFELSYLQNQQQEEEKDKNILARATEHLIHINNSFSDLFSVVDLKQEITTSTLEKVLEYYSAKAISFDSNIDYIDRLSSLIDNLLSKTISLESELNDRILLWQSYKKSSVQIESSKLYQVQNELKYTKKAQVKLLEQHLPKAAILKEQLNKNKSILISLKLFISGHKSGLKLKMYIASSDKILWQDEKRLMLSNLSSHELVKQIEILAISIAKNKNVQFPLVQYANAKESEKQVIWQLINSVESLIAKSENNLNYNGILEQARDRYNVIVSILDLLAKSPIYRQEIVSKQEFELRKQRQDAEIRVLDAQIVKERIKAQALVQKEKNKAQKLANQKAVIAKERDYFELQKNQALLEIERNKNGKVIKEAVEKNNHEWTAKLDQLKKEQQGLIVERDKLDNELKQLKSQQKNQIIEQHKLEQRIKDLDVKINRSQKIAADLRMFIYSLPYGTNGLSQLKQISDAAYNSLISNW